MRAPQAHHHRNGDATTPSGHVIHPSTSTLSQHKAKRFNALVLAFRLAAFSFSLASSIFMVSISNSSNSLRWYDFEAFRYVAAATGIVAIYSLLEIGASVWEISKDATLFPELLQVWFDFGHDQAFAYLLLSANSAGTVLARTLKEGDTCATDKAFCVQSDISIALGFAGFLFLALSSLLSGFRVACFIINGSRFHV